MLRSFSTRFALSPARKHIDTSHLFVRNVRHQAYDASLDQDELAEARKWLDTFDWDTLPRGLSSFSRSSGPGGQHVNKTETKATTRWPISELSKVLPKIMHQALRDSDYYTRSNDSITLSCQTQRNKTANADENRTKLIAELQKIYKANVPEKTSAEKIKKYERLANEYREHRLQLKKRHSSKKASRRGYDD
ncbi:hypothetical protein F5B19DRAFT_91291 [Rostrohypoxylon terebratum]|nr:hypothetical protein F5B19DRAFT_91291 [Rostrohypoxylon terebratum]